MVATDASITTNASEVLATILEPIARCTDGNEAQVTEEMLRVFDNAAVRTQEEGATGLIVASMDFKALYTSIDHNQSAKDVVKEFIRSGMTIEGMDYRVASIYIAANSTRGQLVREGISYLIPTRIHAHVSKLTVRTKELAGGISRKQDKQQQPYGPQNDADETAENQTGDKNQPHPKTKFKKIPQPYTNSDKKRLTVKVLEIAVNAILNNHVYKFGNKFYKQRQGGPIGLRLTGVVARLVMDGWTRTFKEKLVEAGVTLDMIVKYVDDINMGIRPIPKGMRWSKEWQLQWDPDQMLVDIYLTPTQDIDRCMGLIRE